MPELPELRVHAERLARSHSGSVLERFTPLSFTALKTFQPDPAAAVGTALTAVRTRGKYLIAEFGDLAFIVHLMQGGRLTPETGRARKPRGGLARWEFDGVASWLLTEAGHERRAGVWVVAGETEGNEPLDGLGPDADSVDEAALSAILATAGGARLHGVLRDQRRIAGIGRRLANEICWAAELSPFAPSARLESEQRSALLAAIQRCIGASIEDEATRDTMVRSAERLAAVHHRSGEACLRCGDVLRQVSYNAYEVDYCAACQTGGKVLADNTTSKFLR